MLNAPRRNRLLACLATAGAMLTLLTPSAGAQEPTTITAEASTAGGAIVVSGRLTSHDQPVVEAEVEVRLEAGPAQTVHTDGDGQFGATLALPASAGRQRITVGFVGRGELAPTSVELLLDGAAAAAPEPSTPSAATPPADTRRRTTLSAELDDTSLYPGELLSITGSLRAGDAPVPSREVHVWLAGKEHPDSLTFTSERGSFTAYLEVPADQPPGRATLRISYPGSDSYHEGEATAAITIQEVTPQEETEAASSAPAEPVAPQPPAQNAVLEATPDGGAASGATAEPREPEEQGGDEVPAGQPAAFPWLAAVALVAAGAAALLAIALLTRRNTLVRERRDRENGIGSLDLLDEQD